MQRLGQWILPVLVASLTLGLVELCFAAASTPLAVSAPLGALATLVFLSSLFAVAGGLLAAPLWLVRAEHVGAKVRPQAALSLVLTSLLACFFFLFFLWTSSRVEWDFEQSRLAVFALTFFVLAMVALASRPFVERMLARVPWVRNVSGERWLGGVLGAASLLALGAVHWVLAPIHQVSASLPLTGFALIFAVLSSRLLLPKVSGRVLKGVGGLLLLLVLSLPLQRHRSARFVVHTSASGVAPLALLWRGLGDRDGDGAASQWLGGEDCDDGNVQRGPAHEEIVGDGIDQDCRGGDGSVGSPATKTVIGGECLTSTRQSVLLITIDAMRADALTEEITPHLFRFSKRATRFNRAYSPSTMTRPSMGSVMTGRRVSELYGPNPLRSGAPRFDTTLAREFKEAGYRTMSLNFYPLDEATTLGFSERNLGQFDIQPKKGQLLAASITNATVDYIQELDGAAYFAWVHYPDVHAPYAISDEAPLNYPTGASSAYLRGVEYVDYHVGRLLKWLSNSERLKETIVVVSSDHGEDLGERGRLGHGPYLFEDAIHVPLLIAAPGCPSTTIEQPVSLRALASTLASVADRKLAGPSLSLLPGVQESPVVVEESPANKVGFKRAVISGDWKLMVDVQNGGAALFHLKNDPQETKNLYGVSPQTEKMQAVYQSWLDSM